MTSSTAIHGQVSSNIRGVLALWDLTQADVASWLGIKPGSMSDLMSGRRPWSLNYLDVIAGRCGVTVSDLTGSRSALLKRLPAEGPFASAISSAQELPRLDSNQEPAG